MAGPCSTLIMTRSSVTQPAARNQEETCGDNRKQEGEEEKKHQQKTNNEGGIGPTELKNLLNKAASK